MALALALPMLVLGSTAYAQQVGSTDTARPVTIRAGDCLAPGEVVAELRDLVVGPNDRGALEFVGAQGASVVEESETTVPSVTLPDLTGSPHAIVVRESEGSDTVIACGEIGGFVVSNDEDLAVGLRSQNDSGFGGIALLDGDDDDNEVDVDVYLAATAAGNAATPGA
jgi:hypothetical protein